MENQTEEVKNEEIPAEEVAEDTNEELVQANPDIPEDTEEVAEEAVEPEEEVDEDVEPNHRICSCGLSVRLPNDEEPPTECACGIKHAR